MDKVYLIKDITEYGKLMAYCIENDITVWRTYWDEREKGKRCYHVDWKEKRCWYSDRKYWEETAPAFGHGEYKVVVPRFGVDQYGKIILEGEDDA